MPEDVLKGLCLSRMGYMVYFGAKYVETMLDILSQVEREGVRQG
ncbi:MAG: hypothetical protein QW175_03725 [Candidatus Bathyarchaeia archaeon]